MQIAPEIVLPCQPRVYALLMRELLPETPNLRRLNQLFGTDPVLAGLLLESANAPAQQMAGQVSAIAQAVALLGVRHLRAVLKKAQAGLALRPVGALELGQLAQVSVASAKLARSLAAMTRLDAGVAYAAALLHAIGVMHSPAAGSQLAEPALAELGLWDPRRARLEHKYWGYSTSRISAAMLRQWHVPAAITVAMEGMEQPMALERFDPMAAVLHLAVWCQRAKHSGWSERQMADAFPVDVALALGVDVDVVLQQEATDWSKSLY